MSAPLEVADAGQTPWGYNSIECGCARGGQSLIRWVKRREMKQVTYQHFGKHCQSAEDLELAICTPFPAHSFPLSFLLTSGCR